MGEIELLRKYAPILWRASGEPFYPTLPQPDAFDGIDNDNDGHIDIADPDEISIALRYRDKSQRLTYLAESFRAKRPEARVLYKGPDTFEFGKRNDRENIKAIQLWFYYVADVGTGSHDGDSEHAFIFVNPEAKPAAGLRPEVQPGTVRAVVGAGHTEDTANNILATGSLASPGGVMPSRLPYHMPFLIELGKHATAPDLTMDGRFNRGIDSNVFRQASWGSRDGFGIDLLEFFSGYREEYSLARSIKGVILEEYALQSPERDQYLREFPHHFTNVEQFEDGVSYRFFPISDLEGLYRILRKAAVRTVNPDGEKELESRTALRKELGDFLEEHKECFWSSRDGRTLPEKFDLDEYQFAAFMQWLVLPDDHAQVWEKRDYKNPEDIFKTYLFPRVDIGTAATVWAQDKPPGMLLAASIRLAEFSVGTKPVMNDSSLEVYANYQLKTTSLYDFGLIYRYFRGYGGPYFGIGWRGENRRGSSDLSPEELARVTAEFGSAAAAVLPRFDRHAGIDLGYAISVNLGRIPRARILRHLTLGATFGLRSELFAENLSPIEEALNPNLPRRTRAQLKLSLHYGAVGPGHPLKR